MQGRGPCGRIRAARGWTQVAVIGPPPRQGYTPARIKSIALLCGRQCFVQSTEHCSDRLTTQTWREPFFADTALQPCSDRPTTQTWSSDSASQTTLVLSSDAAPDECLHAYGALYGR